MDHIRRRRVTSFFVLSVAALMLLPAAPSTAARTCESPEPELKYSGDTISVTLDLDLRGCRWWKGDAIDLFGELFGDPVGSGTGAFRSCGYAVQIVEDDRGRMSKADTESPIMRRCRLKLHLEHAPVEVARYAGSFEYPWKGGPVTHDFEYLCVSSPVMTECRE